MKHFALWNLSRSYPPTLMLPAIESTVNGFSSLFPSIIKTCYSYWQEGKNSYIYNHHELTDTVNKISETAFIKPKTIRKFFIISYNKARHLNKYAGKYQNKDLSRINTGELISFYTIFNKKFRAMYDYGTLLAIFGYKQDNALYQKADKILKLKTGNNS